MGRIEVRSVCTRERPLGSIPANSELYGMPVFLYGDLSYRPAFLLRLVVSEEPRPVRGQVLVGGPPLGLAWAVPLFLDLSRAHLEIILRAAQEPRAPIFRCTKPHVAYAMLGSRASSGRTIHPARIQKRS